MKNKKYIDNYLDSLVGDELWKEIKHNDCHTRIEDDSSEGMLSVGMTVDGDMWIKTDPPKEVFRTMLRFRVGFGGGGQSERVRKALLVLAMAIKAENDDERK